MSVRLAAAMCTFAAALPAQGAPGRKIDARDLARVRELWQLTDAVGERLWPRFDTRRIPIAINHHDQEEVLIAHPSPPAEFRPFAGQAIDGEPVLIRDGCTRHGPRSGGWAVDLGGVRTAYVGSLEPGRSTEDWLCLLLHECFHVYQKRLREPAKGRLGELPEDDPAYSAMIGLESRVLHAALSSPDHAEVAELTRTFVAVRHERRRRLPEDVIRHEGEQEWNEGTAKYVEARLAQVLWQELALEPAARDDASYGAFADAEQRYHRYVGSVLPPLQAPITWMHAQYQLGMAQALLLDRLRPGWKKEMSERGSTQFALLERTCAPAPGDEAELVRAARERFDYAELLAGQRRVVEAQLAKIRGYLEAKGRRYRIWHGALRGGFDWKPEGPVHRVPSSLLPAGESGPVTIWAGGIRRFAKAGLLFASQDVPVLFRQDRLEWVDGEPAADGSDFVVESDSIADGVHLGLRARTKGFTLTVPRARIVQNGDVVDIRPVP